jgi:hypothetical protein
MVQNYDSYINMPELQTYVAYIGTHNIICAAKREAFWC